MRIPEFYDILNEIQILSSKNKSLEDTLRTIQADLDRNYFSSPSCDSGDGLLPLLLDSAKRNSNKVKTAYRHDDTVKLFMSYIRMLGGRLLYDTLHANLPKCIPSPSVVNQYIADKGPKVIEGELRTEELFEYLIKRGLPLMVCISEDGTRMIGKVSYDPRTNKLVGFPLPLNKDGMPITNSFLARSSSKIETHYLNNSPSTIAYCIMAQPVVENIPPFALTLFSTDNKFISLSVRRRWLHITIYY